MCDTLCAVGRGRALFAKNSDRPTGEVQIVEAHPTRPGGGRLQTQYLEIEDAGAFAVLGSRPSWLWGFEHGLNEHRVAVGNEKVYTVDDPYEAEPGLIGMDLVRLVLERARDAEGGVSVLTELLERHGQGGVADESSGEPYFSSFLIGDPGDVWVVETSGRTWAARRAAGAAAISNRISLGSEWDRASADVAPSTDFGRWRLPTAPTGHADVRLAATTACLTVGPEAPSPADLVAVLRHHGERPWGAPGADPTDVSTIPRQALPDGAGVSVCMHIRGYQATTSSIVAELPQDPAEPCRAWVALGSPCASVYVPVFPPDVVPPELSDAGVWKRMASLRDRAEASDDALAEIRAVLGPVEAELWREADEAAGSPEARRTFVEGAWTKVDAALSVLGA